MKIVIIEDEKEACDRLIRQINELKPNWDVVACISSIKATVEWFYNNPAPDLIFLDVHLLDGTCFEIFDKTVINSPVIFTTAFDEFTMKAFELNSIDYLLKPLNINKLSQALHKYDNMQVIFGSGGDEKHFTDLPHYLNNRQVYRLRFLIPLKDGYIPVSIKHISYFLVEDNYIFIVTQNNEKYPFHYSLDKLEKELDPKLFWRANRSCIVSANSIVKAHNYFNYKIKLELKPKSTKDVIISRKKVNDFKIWFNS